MIPVRAWAALGGVLAILAAAWAIDARAFSRGHAAATAEARAAQDDLEARLRARTAALRGVLEQLREAEAARARDLERLSDDANAAPGARDVALPAGSVRRLRTHWSRD